jgi:methionyl aminopeptidase
MKEQAEVVSKILLKLRDAVAPGITTNELENIALQEIENLGAESFNKGYHPSWANSPFPSALCTSINYQVAHGFPSDRVLVEGDIISLDIGIRYKGLCGDAGLTVPVGKVENKNSRLLYYAYNALFEGIKHVRNGVKVEEIASAIETYCLRRGYVVNKQLSGHAIGKQMHEDPAVWHTMDASPLLELQKTLKTGQVICIEPELTYKDTYGIVVHDWTIETRDRKNSAFFEHMIEVTEDGSKILTNHLDGYAEKYLN